MEPKTFARIGVLSVICLTVFMPILVTSVQAAPLTWFVETVDAANNVGQDSSLALDSNDYPHISYYDSYWQDLKYARWWGDVWGIGPVDTVGAVGKQCSLALDSNDHPHISYLDQDNWDLKYTTFYVANNTSVQITTSVDTTDDVGDYSSIAIDSLDRPHISYYDHTHDSLKYARWTGTAWAIETVDDDPSGIVGVESSLALDSDDRPHISYCDMYGNLKYANWTGTSWNIVTVEEVDVSYTSIALDSNDNPHISYNDYFANNLKYARWTGTAWAIETVDASLSVGDFCSLALDSYDYPHISYYDSYWQDLKYATWTDYGWFIKNVDSVGDVGNWGTSIALDSNGNPHISYCDYTNNNLKYARDPNEYFYYVDYAPFDRNGDSFNDGVEVAMDVDTTYPGSLNISVLAFLTDEFGMVHSSNASAWTITGELVEYRYVHLHLPEGSPEGWYNIGLTLYDERSAIEDWRLIEDAVYLFPPNMRELTVEVTGSGTTDPAPGSWWAPEDTELMVTAIPDSGWILDHWVLDSVDTGSDNPITVLLDADHSLTAVFVEESQTGWLEGTVTDIETDLPIGGANVTGFSIDAFFVVTNASGQYRIELRQGTYNVTAEKPGYESVNTVLDVIADSTTIQDFALHPLSPPMRELSIETHGEGTTAPSPGVHLIPEGEQVAVEALPAYGWILDHWMLDDVDVGNANPLNVTMDTDHLLLSVFAEDLPPLQAEIESCNPDGIPQDYYVLGETIYVTGGGYSPSLTYDLYVVEDVDSWIDGMAIPERVPETETTISSNIEGHIVPTNVWNNPQTVGKYDIVVDVNGNGQYDSEIDALDNNDVEVTAGLVIPEFPSFLILLVFMSGTLLLAVIIHKRKEST